MAKTMTTLVCIIFGQGILANFLILLWACLKLSAVWGAHGITPKSYNTVPPPETILDVTKFGAVGDGSTNDSKAFDSAWKAACKEVSERVKISVPSGKTFLLSPMAFEGPCKPLNITFEVLGTIVAQPKSHWKERPEQWLSFHGVDGLTLVGNDQGVIDGQGKSWWGAGYKDITRPHALQIIGCNNLRISGLQHINSPMFHVSIKQCNNANISRLHIISPETSPNTDGIDVGSSSNIRIENCTIETGDDCIAIKGGTKNINISEINCGPGHGISIGSLGQSEKDDEVEAITVRNCTFNGSQNGVRIKTWQGGSGFARNINFFNLSFIETSHPIIIDQYYCPHSKCIEKTSTVEVSEVKYIGLQGTSRDNPTISLRCSNSVPCTNILLQDIDIISHGDNSTSVECNNAHGLAIRTVNPVVSCLVK